MARGSLQLEDLLKVVLILVIAWLTLGLVERALGIVSASLRPLSPVVGGLFPGVNGIPGGSVIALIIVLAVLVWLLD